MSRTTLINENPIIYEKNEKSLKEWIDFFDEIKDDKKENNFQIEAIDKQEIYSLLANITDPEHPLTLEQLAVVNLDDIYLQDDETNKIIYLTVELTPTIPHCSMATLIGLCVRVRLERCLPPRFRINVKIKKDTHQSEKQVNKQLRDKERVAAALENQQLANVIHGMMASCV
ncbi:iron-sulfur cluster assembly protein CIA2 [Pneumocystis jirovecii RU7]|uniref:MIP18 family-like domain-containing protein n=1 Tax=Pneumocystis jirovecii (strain RU7) TaxID=1408657 RepID=A0A0W4ZW33_PNEJ7|nr:iron-sulfur cluster assembly protein CIA2 [Pneumocystis jirovecii RU7]KTW32576.1 hypothetical protein T551_00061 [Pneumocystis jirovecii RU7]